MKKIYIIALLSFFLVSCGGNDNETIVNDFVVALSNGDFARAKELSTPETVQIIEIVEKEYNENKDKIDVSVEIKVEIINVVEVENAANYTIKIIIGEQTQEVVINLVLVNEVYVVEMPAEEIVVIQYIVFRGQYSVIIVIENNVNETIIYRTHRTKTKKTKKSGTRRRTRGRH